MERWTHQAIVLLERQPSCALVTVVSVQGSAPVQPGAKMLVWADGQSGTIGGGNLEWTVADQARRLVAQSDRLHALQKYPLGPLLRQCCGGNVRILIEKLTADSRPWLQAADAALAAGAPQVLRTRLSNAATAKEIVPASGAPVVAVDEAGGTVAERLAPPPRTLFVFGAGHVGRASVPILETLGPVIVWIDPRAEAFPQSAGPDTRMVVSDDPAGEVACAPPGAVYLVFTHSHDLDYQVVEAVLRRGDFGHCGLIGSETKRARFMRRFTEAGIDPIAIDRLACPVGLPTLKSKSPAIIAVSIAASLAGLIETQPASAGTPWP